MWKWDQGRMAYFQYDNLRTMANFIVHNDFKNCKPKYIREVTNLPFSAPETHSPWRNYARIYKICLLLREANGIAVPTEVAKILATPGLVTCDEYIHFLIEATTDPSPSLADWSKIDTDAKIRSPLCFSLKYILAKAALRSEFNTPIDEIINAYIYSNFTGYEDDTSFIALIMNKHNFSGKKYDVDIRQARESLKFICQISYLYNAENSIFLSLDRDDALEIFHSINPIMGPHCIDGNDEIARVSTFFRDGTNHDFFDYKSTIITDVTDSGFLEGSKVKKTHIVIERNSKLRKIYFEKFPVSVCDTCSTDTKIKYPWADRILDLHHILPLSSGTQVDAKKGTLLDDMKPICPTCHRAVHRYYDTYMRQQNKYDFENKQEAMQVYHQAKTCIIKGSVNV